MPINFKKKRPFDARKFPLSLTQQLKENVRRVVEIFVGQNSVGDGDRAGGMVHVFAWSPYVVSPLVAIFPFWRQRKKEPFLRMGMPVLERAESLP